MNELHDIELNKLIEKETGERFNREGYIKCPFHKEKTPSMKVRFFPDRNKQKYKCFGCGATGDAIDFISNYKNLDYNAAREYLDLEVKKNDFEISEDKVRNYIDWQLEHTKKDYKFLGLFTFVDEDNTPIYYKAKFRKPDGKKETPYYCFDEDGKVANRRGTDEVPYNLFNVLNAIENNKVIVFVEGEKDANMINNTLKNTEYVATSIKGVTDYTPIKQKDMRIYVIGDTGEAGTKYIDEIKKEFFGIASEFKVINLPGLKKLGDNKDVTDWLEDLGHNKYDLFRAFSRSLNLKDNYELQQDSHGIYRSWPSKTNPDEYKKQYLTDFQVVEAKRLRFIEEDREGVRLLLKSNTGDLIERIGPSSKFDDVKAFKNFLGTLDLAFKGKPDDVTDLKSWINKYWALENEEIYTGDKFIVKDGLLNLVTGDGAINGIGVNNSLISNNNDIKILDIESISREEIKELKGHIFKFTETSKAISIIGTVINDLAIYQNQEIGEKLPHLLIVGESQSGKTTILEKVIAQILNYPVENKKSIGNSSNWAMQRDLSTGNYPSLYDEFKPSMMDKYKMQKLSGLLRDLYDRQVINKGDKTLNVKSFQLTRPLIMAGEESYPNSETALITRSCIVYLSRNERTKKNSDVMQWMVDNQIILNKFGRSIIDTILNLKPEEYKAIRNSKRSSFKNLKERALDTAISIAAGIEIFNILLENFNLKKIENYEEFIYKNIKEEILENEEDTRSTVENMLVLYNDIIENGRIFKAKDIVKNTGEGLFIRTSEMINEIFKFVKDYGSAEVVPLKLRDFKKQAAKAGYLLKQSGKVFKIEGQAARFDEYSASKFRNLHLDAIVEPEIYDQSYISKAEQKVIEGVFNK